MKKALLTTLLIIALNSGCTVPISTQNNPTNTHTTRGTPPPSSTTNAHYYHQLRTVQGPIVTVGERGNGFIFPQYQGKIVLLQIFGKECKFCFEEMPIIRNIRTRYAQNLQVIALQAQDPMSRTTASNLIHRFQMYYPIVDRNNASNLLLFIRKTYGWNGILPYTLLIKNGITEYSFKGKIEQQELEESIRTLL